MGMAGTKQVWLACYSEYISSLSLVIWCFEPSQHKMDKYTNKYTNKVTSTTTTQQQLVCEKREHIIDGNGWYEAGMVGLLLRIHI